MRKKPHPQHVAIAKKLGTTPGALHALLSIHAGRSPMNRGPWLRDQGMVEVDALNHWQLTRTGAEVLGRARAMGF